MAYPMNADFIAPQAGGFEPQRQNHFDVEFQNISTDMSFAISTFTLPGISNDPITIPFRNEERKVAGPARVDEASLSIRDYVDAQVHNAFMSWRRLVFDPTTGIVGRAANYKRQGSLFVFGPDGEIERSWTLVGCWPSHDPPLSLDSGSGQQ